MVVLKSTVLVGLLGTWLSIYSIQTSFFLETTYWRWQNEGQVSGCISPLAGPILQRQMDKEQSKWHEASLGLLPDKYAR
jgi:hypothetical protein